MRAISLDLDQPATDAAAANAAAAARGGALRGTVEARSVDALHLVYCVWWACVLTLTYLTDVGKQTVTTHAPGRRHQVRCADALRLGAAGAAGGAVAAASVDLVLADLPYGSQHARLDAQP